MWFCHQNTFCVHSLFYLCLHCLLMFPVIPFSSLGPVTVVTLLCFFFSPRHPCNLLKASLPFTGPVNVRSHPAPEAPGNSIGLEAIIRKALMGKYDDQSEERSPSNAANQMGSGAAMSDGRGEDCFSQGATFSNMFIFLRSPFSISSFGLYIYPFTSLLK